MMTVVEVGLYFLSNSNASGFSGFNTRNSKKLYMRHQASTHGYISKLTQISYCSPLIEVSPTLQDPSSDILLYLI